MKKLLHIGIFLISIIIIILGGALIYNKFFFKKNYTEVEKVMLEAAKEYYTKHEEKLPQNIGETVSVTIDTLIKNKHMETIKKYTKSNVTCDGEVIVTNINKDYRYTPVLDCGKKYQTQTFTDYINKNVDNLSKVVDTDKMKNSCNIRYLF